MDQAGRPLSPGNYVSGGVNFRPTGEGGSGREPLLPKRGVTFW